MESKIEESKELHKEGRAKAYLNDYEGAIKALNKAHELNSKNPEFLSDRGAVKLMMNDYKGSKEDCSKAYKLRNSLSKKNKKKKWKKKEITLSTDRKKKPG